MATVTRTWTEKYLEMNHGKTRYWEAGAGYPTVLIHGAGWTSGCESWALNMGPLGEKLHVYAIDCLNWGTGDILDQELSFAYLVDRAGVHGSSRHREGELCRRPFRLSGTGASMSPL